MQEIDLSLRAHLASEARRFGIAPKTLSVTPLLNWGGFDNASFSVTDGRRRLHVKLSARCEQLRRFYNASPILSERYRCPNVLGWIDLPNTDVGGLVFDAVDGGPIEEIPSNVMHDLGRTLEHLHDDDELRALLGNDGARCVDTYLGIYDRRFAADLELIVATPPPFVTPEVLAFMHAEASNITAQAIASAAFQEPARAPIHADIWEHNILIDRSGTWFLIDWDGLRIGDPALDWAMAAGMAQTFTGTGSSLGIPSIAAIQNRIDLYHRAMHLDRVIDVLADWIMAAEHPQWMMKVRTANEAHHRRSLDLYRALYS
jgi:Phosphotransferase enzyme family